jgi:hypothetical protein
MSSINVTAINVEAINSASSSSAVDLGASFNSAVLNTVVMDGNSVNPGAIVIAGLTVATAQQNVVVLIGAATPISIEEDVRFLVAYAGNVVLVEQSICNIYVGNAISIEQRVYDLSANTFFKRNGWDLDITIAGVPTPHDRIFRDVTITQKENQSNQASFTLLVANPVAFIDAVWGKPVTIDYITSTGTTRLFTGVIAIPEINLIAKTVMFTCSNNRDELINNTLYGVVKTVGRYSESVQNKFNTPAEEMNLRMTTIPYSLDFTGTNTPKFTPWATKATPDFTLYDADIYYRDPKVVWQDRTVIKNNINIIVKYQYTRLYHYQRAFSWTHPYNFCDNLFGNYSLPNVSMIEFAIASAGWKNSTPIIYTSVWPPGFCVSGASIVYWNTTSLAVQGTHSTVFDSLGNVISDPDGHNIYNFKPFTKDTDKTQIYTIGANWVAAARFSQYIEEVYNINVHSTQSIGQFGAILDGASSSVQDQYDSSTWDAYKVVTPAPAGSISFSGGSYYSNQSYNSAEMQNAVQTQIDIAKTKILATHRNTQVIVETPIKPAIELSHTVSVMAAKVTAIGKVQEIVHTLAVAEGKGSVTKLTLAISRSQGSATTTPTNPIVRPTDAINLPYDAVTLGSHYGIDPPNPAFNGMIGNKKNPIVAPGALLRTNVAEEFRVDTPAIPDAYVKIRQLPVAASFEIAIPNDNLVITL